MRKNIVSVLFLAAAVMLVACEGKQAEEAPSGAPAGQAMQTGGTAYEGKVLSTMDVGNYTYVEFENNGMKYWAAGPITPVKVGDMVALGEGAAMANFHSKGLDRTFDSILFTGEIRVEGSDGETAPGASAPHGDAPAAPHANLDAPAKGSVAKVKGGYTVEELYAKKADLGGKSVQVRGKVMKANSGIMGTNWYHLQDGTGEGATADLMVTSDSQAAVGDLVVATGKMTLGKDLGAGYKYDVIVEGAELKAE